MDKKLKLVHLQLTKKCNLRCSFCGQWGDAGFMRNGEKASELEFSDWEKVIDSIAAYADKQKIKPQFILWGGEPLLSPSFANIAVLLKSYGFETGLVTNGTLLDKFAAVINENIDVLYISLDGPEEIHDRIRGQTGTFRKIIAGLKSIDCSKVRVVGLTTICRDNYAHLVDFPGYVAEKLPVVDMLIYQNIIYVSPEEARSYSDWALKCFGKDPGHISSWINGTFDSYVDELPAIIGKIEEKIRGKAYPVEVKISPDGISSANVSDWYSGKKMPDENVVCRMPSSHLHVRSDGKVDMCVDFDDFSAGNVHERDVMDIFNGPEAEKFRKIFQESQPSICKRCPWRCNRRLRIDLMKMMSNVIPEIGLKTLIHGLDTWEKHTGVRPSVGWNPECGWTSYIPEIYKAAGFKSLVMDADSFLLSFDQIRKATGLSYDVQGHSNKNHLFKIEEFIKDKTDFLKYLTNPSVAENGLQLIFRSDCMANPMLWYLMGATEGNRETPVALDEIRSIFMNWKNRIASSGTFIMPYAEDAEYIGTSAYFYVKQFNQARFFEPEPDSILRFKELLGLAKETGYELSLPSEVLASGKIFKNEYVNCIENGAAWHGGTAKAWANTEHSRIMDPVCLAIYYGIKAVGDYIRCSDPELEKAVKAVTSAYVSDSRWPPPPTSPGRFNVKESIADLYEANRLLGAVMERKGIANLKSLYSPNLMGTQIKCIEDKLMGMKYFGE